jgi:transposase
VNHIGIDLGQKESQLCIRSPDGVVLKELRIRTSLLERELQRHPPGRVLIETSCEAFSIADRVKAAGHEVRVVPSVLVRALGVGHRGIKNDVRDARALSEASVRSDLPSVHIPSTEARDRKALCTSLAGLKQARTKLVNTVRSWNRSGLGTRVRATPKTLPSKLRAQLESQGGIPTHVEALLASIETLSAQIRVLEDELRELARRDEVCRRLMTVPGVGPITAMTFVAAIDDIERFKTADALASYLGLTPGENTTGFKIHRTRLTKAGQPQVRHCLGQAALSWQRFRPDDPMVRWAQSVAERRGKQKARVALARKLAHLLRALWRDGSVYDPRR